MGSAPHFAVPVLAVPILVMALGLLMAVPAAAADLTYIQEDATLAGQTMHVFEDAGEQVTIVVGGFRLEVGKRTVSGREAVLWIKEYKFGQGARRDIILYVKGNARILEPDGAATGDQSMLVALHQQGRLAATGPGGGRINLARQSLVDDPLYLEALTVRQKSSARRPGETTVSLPPILTLPATGPAVPTTPAPRPTPPAATQPKKPAKPKLPQAVTFRFDKMTVQEVRELEPGQPRHAIVVQGNVHLTQGDLHSDLFLELQSQSAVVFTETVGPEAKRKATPYAPPMVGMTGAGGGEGVAGVYLEGNVIIARGEKTMTAKAAYYDFVHDQAYVVEPIFRTIQAQRNIPIYIRADEARVLSANEAWFKNARLTTSDFHTPEYHIGASEMLFKDATEYDETGKQVSERKYQGTLKNETFNLWGVPVAWWPYSESEFQEGTIPLRRASLGSTADMGFGVETEWDLFRLLGLIQPDGATATLDLNAYANGVIGGVDTKYARRDAQRQYSGYWKFYGIVDSTRKDTFGPERKDLPAPEDRGWAMMRHKELLPQDVELQFELSYLSDRNFLERYFPSEFFAGKEQETLLYAKKQRDNWAVSSLLQARVNNFLTQAESYPDLAFFLIGESLLGDRLTYFNESRAGVKRWRPDDDSGQRPGPVLGRADTRNELDWPLQAGPIKVVPYAVARGTAWSASPDPTGDTNNGGGEGRPYGQAGVKAQTHVWRVYDDVDNRLLDLHKLKHEMTPQVAGFVSGDGGVGPADLFPMDPGIEQHLGQVNAASLALYQRLMTKRGTADNPVSVDWMRLDVMASFYDNHDIPVGPADGRFFLSRPEYSLPRDAVNSEYTWNLSDATAFLSDLNYDIESAGFGRADAGFAVTRDPRLRYYFGWRYIRDLDASVGTLGTNYQINKKYSVSLFEQYDFLYDNGRNLATSLSLIRKFPRWYGAFTFAYDQRNQDVTVFVTFWPEGVPEVRLTGNRVNVLGQSSNN